MLTPCHLGPADPGPPGFWEKTSCHRQTAVPWLARQQKCAPSPLHHLCASPRAVSRKARKNASWCRVGLRQALIYLSCLVCVFALSNALFVLMVDPNQSISTNQLGGSTETDLRPQSLAGIWDFGASLSFDAEQSGTPGTHRTCQGHANNGSPGLQSLAHSSAAQSST